MDAPTTVGFPIVGIGASAGGWAAFEAFYPAIPVDVDTGMAFVLVQIQRSKAGLINTMDVRTILVLGMLQFQGRQSREGSQINS